MVITTNFFFVTQVKKSVTYNLTGTLLSLSGKLDKMEY